MVRRLRIRNVEATKLTEANYFIERYSILMMN